MRILSGFLFAATLACGLPGTAMADTSTLSGVSRQMNPAISVNGLLRAQMADKDDSADLNGFSLDGVEAQFTSMVDPFWKANVIIGLHPAHTDPDAEVEEVHAHGTEFALGVEEALLESLSMPGGLGLKLGRYRLPFGKTIPLHKHQFAFADAPVGVTGFFGEHAPVDTGVQVLTDLPLPWYSDLNLYGVSGSAAIFDGNDKALAYGARLTNLWDVSADATVELSGSWLHGRDGRHPGEGMDLGFLGVDLTYKWVSSTRTGGPALTLTGEIVLPKYEEGPVDPLGWYAQTQYRFARNWWLGAAVGQARAEAAEPSVEPLDPHDHGFTGDLREYKLNLTFTPSHFSFLRGEVGYFTDEITGEDDFRGIVQANFTIGSHPAHLY